MTADQQVFKPTEVAALTGLHPNTVRNMVARGELTNTFAHLELRRIGIPRAEVERLISPVSVVEVPGERGGPSLSGIAGSVGHPNSRTAGGSNPPAA